MRKYKNISNFYSFIFVTILTPNAALKSKPISERHYYRPQKTRDRSNTSLVSVFMCVYSVEVDRNRFFSFGRNRKCTYVTAPKTKLKPKLSIQIRPKPKPKP